MSEESARGGHADAPWLPACCCSFALTGALDTRAVPPVKPQDNSSEVLEPLSSRRLYVEDWIGLKKLDMTGRLHFAAVDCPHTSVATARCKLQVRRA